MSKLKIYDDSVNYTATIVKLHALQDVPGLDNLKKVVVFGNDCLIGKDTDLTQDFVYFPAECKLSEQFCRVNNLYRHETLNKDITQKGFFDDSGRVKSLKFKGVTSTCFVIPTEAIYNVVGSGWKMEIGDEFNCIGDIEICKKYKVVNQHSTGTKESKHNKALKRFDKLVPNQFRFHLDTSPLAKNLHVFSPEDIISITVKYHGTSAVFSNVLINKQLKWYEKLAKKVGLNIVDKVYDNLYASRSVIKNSYINLEATLGFYNEDIWGTVNKELSGKIEEGITLYTEIVGYLESGKMIQKGYDYGCDPHIVGETPNKGGHRNLVYRITYTKPNGEVIEFSWNQIKDYCKKYQLETVKELHFGKALGIALYLDEVESGTLDNWRDKFLETLQSSWNMEQDCPYCINKVPFEGIVCRLDGKESFSAYKLKAKAFVLRESKELDSGETNIEDNQIVENESTNN